MLTCQEVAYGGDGYDGLSSSQGMHIIYCTVLIRDAIEKIEKYSIVSYSIV